MANYTIEAVTQARLQSPEGLRQRMRTRHGRILGDVELPTDLRWDPIIHALCSLLQQATDRDKKSPLVQVVQIQDSDGVLAFRVAGHDDYQGGLIAMAEALSASWPAPGLKDDAEGKARYKELKTQHGRILGQGLECDAGWIKLITVLCDGLQHATDNMGAPQVETLQVKEKFGTLRFYITQCSEHQRGLIDLACAMSSKTCEHCGRPGSVWVSGGYFHTACDEHRRPQSITVGCYVRQRDAI